MKIITWVRNSTGVHVAYTKHETSRVVKTVSYPSSYTDQQVRAALEGKKITIPVTPPPPPIEQTRQYGQVPEDIAPDQTGKEESAMTRKAMLEELNAAGIKGYNTARAEDVKTAYDKAVAEGKIK